MIKPVELASKNISLYQEFMSEELQEALHGLSRSLNGLRVVHINSTADGGGVAEILRSLAPLLQNLGLQVEWYVIDAPEEYFKVTKKLHNYLQGESGTLTREEESLYLRVSSAL